VNLSLVAEGKLLQQSKIPITDTFSLFASYLAQYSMGISSSLTV
jgi:hypothetical protein